MGIPLVRGTRVQLGESGVMIYKKKMIDCARLFCTIYIHVYIYKILLLATFRVDPIMPKPKLIQKQQYALIGCYRHI